MQKSPLFRKVNKTAHDVHRRTGGDFRDERNSKSAVNSEATRTSMHSGAQWGRDYTPLFRFLLSRIGRPWSEVFSEAAARLDRTEPIFWLVALHEHQHKQYVRVGESTYYSGLFVAADGTLQVVNPDVGPSSLVPDCKCCTHTFNGVRFTKPFAGFPQNGGLAQNA